MVSLPKRDCNSVLVRLSVANVAEHVSRVSRTFVSSIRMVIRTVSRVTPTHERHVVGSTHLSGAAWRPNVSIVSTKWRYWARAVGM